MNTTRRPRVRSSCEEYQCPVGIAVVGVNNQGEKCAFIKYETRLMPKQGFKLDTAT